MDGNAQVALTALGVVFNAGVIYGVTKASLRGIRKDMAEVKGHVEKINGSLDNARERLSEIEGVHKAKGCG